MYPKIPLKNILKLFNWYAFKKTDYKESGVLLVRQTNLDWNNISKNKSVYVDKKFLEEKKDFILKEWDILIWMSWNIWKYCFFDLKEPALQNQRVWKLAFSDKVYSKYVLYFLPIIENELKQKAKWVAVLNISWKDLEEIEIPLPPLPTQHLIVSEIEKQFTRLEQWLLSLRRAKENLKKYKASVLKSAVEWKLTEDFRKTQKLEPASILLEKILEERKKKFLSENPGKKYKESEGIKQDDLPNIELPEWWEFVKLDNLWELWRWKSKHRPRNDQKLFWWNYPFIQTWEVTNSNWKITEFTKTYSDFWLSQSKLWPKWTLCITIAANIAYTWFLTFDACFPDSVVWIKVDENYININFIDIYFKNIRQELERYAPATAQKNINLEILNKLPVPLPPLSEQNEIVKIVESKLSVVEKLEKLVDENIKRSENLKQSILKKAFEGEMVREV